MRVSLIRRPSLERIEIFLCPEKSSRVSYERAEYVKFDPKYDIHIKT